VALGQHESHAKVGILIDGAKTPDLISDQTAVKIFFLSITEPADATPEQFARLNVKISRIGLDPTDRDILIAAVQQFHQRFTALKIRSDNLARQIAAGTASRQQFVDVQKQIELGALGAHQSLLARVSPDGATRLKNHLAYLKTKIKVIPPPKM
jgi:hypothetical protein